MMHYIFLSNDMHISLRFDTWKEIEYDFGYVYFEFYYKNVQVALIKKLNIESITHSKPFSLQEILDYKKEKGH